MKRFLGFLSVAVLTFTFVGDATADGELLHIQLRRAADRADSDGTISYTIHLPNGQKKVFQKGKDFDDSELDAAGAVNLELYRGDPRRYVTKIAIGRAIYQTMEFYKDKAGWHYDFHFYF